MRVTLTRPSRWLPRLLAGALLSALVALSLLVAYPGPSGAQPADDPALLRELAERLIAQRFGPTGTEQTVRLLPGALAPLPFELPNPEGTRVIGSAVRTISATERQPFGVTQFTGDMVTVVLDVPLSGRETLRLFEEALTAQGWGQPPFAGRPSAGFQAASTPLTSFRCRDDASPSLTLTISERAAGLTEARIELGLVGGPPCSGPPNRPPPLFSSITLPNLTLPTSARFVSVVGAGGSPLSNASSVMFASAQSAAELEAFFARQLAEAEWTRVDSGGATAAVWSVWRLPGDDEGIGYLFVMAGPAEGLKLAELKAIGSLPAEPAPAAPSAPPSLPPSSP